MLHLNVNTNALIGFTNALERISRTALPNAVRQSLTDTAKDVKTTTMPAEAKATFINRRQNFFKANSRYEGAVGSNINKMHSTVGFYENNLQGNNWAVKDLEQQEHGGTINKKTFIPTVYARKGKNYKGSVKPNARLSSISKIIDAKDSTGKNGKERFVKAAIVAGKGGWVLDRNILWLINSFPKTNLKTRRVKIDSIPMYTVKKGRSVHPHATHFMKDASLKSGKKMEGFFIKNAQKEIEKIRL